MKKLFCLSNEAIQVLKVPSVKLKIMTALDIFDTRTIEKHIKNNFPNGPLMNFNVRLIIKEASPNMQDKDIYRKLSKDDIVKVKEKRKEMKVINLKYNNIKKQDL
jgi:hypothetical protein